MDEYSQKIAKPLTRAASVMLLFFICNAAAAAQTVTVTTVSELHTAVSSANNSGGDTIILVANGTYTLRDTLYINAPNITIAGQSGSREAVIIQGDGMSGTANVGNLIRVAANDFELRDVTLQRSRWHLIQIAGESNADNPKIKNCILRDAYEQMLKVSIDPSNLNIASDNGIVENCLFEYTAGIGPQWYVGGIDAHGAKNWTVRGNTFRNIISPNTAVAEYAVHFWNGSANNIVEQNVIVDCDRGIGFGLGSRGNTGGTIRNNMIYHASNKGRFADVGIAIQNSPGTKIYNNSIFSEHSYPSSIEYRFSATTGVLIANNLTNKRISRLDGASAQESTNIDDARIDWFIDATSGDLHLSSAVDGVVDSGTSVSGLSDDFDGDPRPLSGSGVDIGADEFSVVARPAPPTNFQAE